jgi:predicted acetyltransferase
MSGFAAVRMEVYKKIKPNSIGFKINTELLYKAKKFGFKVTEVLIIFKKRKAGKLKRT